MRVLNIRDTFDKDAENLARAFGLGAMIDMFFREPFIFFTHFNSPTLPKKFYPWRLYLQSPYHRGKCRSGLAKFRE